MMNLGRLLIAVGSALAVLGVIVLLISKLNLPLGRLPGNVVWRNKNATIYFPWVTCVVISLLLTLILWIVNRR